MKKRIQFFKDCSVGFILVLVLLFGTVVVRTSQGISGDINFLAFIFPLLFIPLLVSIFYDSKYDSLKEKKSKKNEEIVYKKDTCIAVVSLMLLLNLIVSMIVLYYAW